LEGRTLLTVTVTVPPNMTAVEGAGTGSRTWATFTYTLGSFSNYTAQIDWGDGTSSGIKRCQEPFLACQTKVPDTFS
jgi:hypothetical protein